MMILQSSHVVVDCPICGRPLEMRSQLVSHEVTCGHCRGEFIVYETDDASLVTAHRKGTDPLERAEQLLLATGDAEMSISEQPYQQRFPLVSVPYVEGNLNHCQDTLLEDTEIEEEPLPTAILVEHRDEVFARLATDMAEFGMHVVRAKSTVEALKLSAKFKPTLVVANIELPGQSGWLMAAKLRLVDRDTCVWLYQCHPYNYGYDIASFLKVESLLDYQGDLLGLSETIVDLMANHRESQNAACTPTELRNQRPHETSS